MLLLLGDDDADSSEDGGGGALLRISAVLALGKAVCRTSKVWIAPSMSSAYPWSLVNTASSLISVS